MLHRLFAVASVLSLLLCMASIVAWVSSYSFATNWVYVPQTSTPLPHLVLWVFESRGRIWLGEMRFDFFPGRWVERAESVDISAAHEFIGFGYDKLGEDRMPLRGIRVPYWFVALATGLIPGYWVARRFTRSRGKEGLCPACGYDLRASKDRCPECGTPIPSTAAPAQNPTISN